MIAQRDSVANIRLGESSLAVSAASTDIAIATSRDSAAMRTIAAVTMVFLPATFTAVSAHPFKHWARRAQRIQSHTWLNVLTLHRLSSVPPSSTSTLRPMSTYTPGGYGFIF